MSDSTQGYDEFQWNNDSIVAMLLIVQGRLTDEQIADVVASVRRLFWHGDAILNSRQYTTSAESTRSTSLQRAAWRTATGESLS